MGKTIDFPRAWEIAQSVPFEEHDPRCSYRLAEGGFLCDCHVLYQSRDYVSALEEEIDALRIQLAERDEYLRMVANKKPDVCKWTRYYLDQKTNDVMRTECGDVTVYCNTFNFCHFCGRRIEVSE